MKKALGLLLVFVLCLSMVACGSAPVKRPVTTQKPTQNTTEGTASGETTAPVETVPAQVQQEVFALVEELFALPEEIATSTETSDTARMLSLINEKTYCTIGTITADSVELTITVPDMKTVFEEQLDLEAVITDPLAESQRMMAAILARLEGADCPSVTNTVTAAILQTEAGMEIQSSDALADAMYGNLLTLFDALYAQMGG